MRCSPYQVRCRTVCARGGALSNDEHRLAVGLATTVHVEPTANVSNACAHERPSRRAAETTARRLTPHPLSPHLAQSRTGGRRGQVTRKRQNEPVGVHCTSYWARPTTQQAGPSPGAMASSDRGSSFVHPCHSTQPATRMQHQPWHPHHADTAVPMVSDLKCQTAGPLNRTGKISALSF